MCGLMVRLNLGKLRKMRLKSCLTSIWKRLIGGKREVLLLRLNLLGRGTRVAFDEKYY